MAMRTARRVSRCKKKSHDPMCLCDVVVKEPVPIMHDYAAKSFMSKRLIETLGLSSPFSDEDILQLLTAQVMVYDSLKEYNRRTSLGISTQSNSALAKLTLGQIAHVEAMYEDGYSHGEVRTYCFEQWGIEIDRVHAHRMRERGEQRRRKHEVH